MVCFSLFSLSWLFSLTRDVYKGPCKKVLKKSKKPRSISIFFVPGDQSVALRSLSKASMLKSLDTVWFSFLVILFSLKFWKIKDCGRWSEMKLVMLPDIHLYSWWFISIMFYEWFMRVIWGMKLLDRTISKNLFAPVFCAYLIKFRFKSPARIVLLLSCFILLSRFSIKSILHL